MAYTVKFQRMSDQAMARVEPTEPSDVDALVASGAILLDIRDKEEYDKDHISGSLNVSHPAPTPCHNSDSKLCVGTT